MDPPVASQLGESKGNCTWFAYGRLLELGFPETAVNQLLGNASVWNDKACENGYGLSRTPVVNWVAQRDAGANGFGHVAIVKEILANGQITIEESSYTTKLGSDWDFTYRERTTSASEFRWYISPLGYGTSMADCSELAVGGGDAPIDSDSDGVPDESDGCLYDPDKIAPGFCNCGVLDTDTDGDGTPDCEDSCPDDPVKAAPGACGCGQPEVDGCGTIDPGRVLPPALCGAGAPQSIMLCLGGLVVLSLHSRRKRFA
jgi:hypothetical protein